MNTLTYSENDKNFCQIAADINREYAAALAAANTALEHAMEAGRLLAEAKECVGHGSWLQWLADNFDGSERTARTYLRIHENRNLIEDAKRQRAADLTIRQATKMLAPPKEPSPAGPCVFAASSFIPPTGRMLLIFAGKQELASVVPSVHEGFYFVAWTEADDFGGSTLHGTKKAIPGAYIIQVLPACFKLPHLYPDGPRRDYDGLLFAPVAKEKWEYNRSLYSSQQEHIKHAVLGMGGAT